MTSNLHAQAINLARRYSIRNENDLLRKSQQYLRGNLQANRKSDHSCVMPLSYLPEENLFDGKPMSKLHICAIQVSMLTLTCFSEDEDIASEITEKYCSCLLERYLPSNAKIPAECYGYDTFRVNLERRLSNRAEEEKAAIIAFQGMSPNETLEAIRAREHGLPHHSQMKRRMTSNNPNKPESTWF